MINVDPDESFPSRIQSTNLAGTLTLTDKAAGRELHPSIDFHLQYTVGLKVIDHSTIINLNYLSCRL